MSLAGLCFDATGTLIETAEPVGEVYRRIALQHGIDLPAWRLQDAFARVLRHAPERGTRGDDPEARRRSELDWWSELVRQTFQATDSTALFDDFRAFAIDLFETYRGADAWRARPGVRSALTELQRRGWPMAVVSNFDHRLLDILQVIELSSFFSRIALPFEVGQAKPARAIFASAAQALDTPIETLAYVGDDAPETLAAIADLGIRVFDAHQIERWSDWIEALGSPATFRATPVEPNRATRT
jgi:putative hydrolase of the HAD superfamily